MTDSIQTLRWIWRDFQFDLPIEWEMLQFSREMEQGRCAFADRYQFRLEMDWCVVQKEPDLSRLMSDYKSKLENEKKLDDGVSSKIASWHGLTGRQGEQFMSRFGHFFPASSCLVELVFLWPELREKAVEKKILQSFCCLAEEGRTATLWQTFGMSMTVPSDYTLTGCKVKPAQAQMTFSAPKKPGCIRFQRLGMVPLWLKMPLENWLRSQTSVFVFDKETQTTTYKNTPAVVLSGVYRPKGVIHTNGYYLSICWVDPVDGRLYFVERIEKEKLPDVKQTLDSLSAQR